MPKAKTLLSASSLSLGLILSVLAAPVAAQPPVFEAELIEPGPAAVLWWVLSDLNDQGVVVGNAFVQVDAGAYRTMPVRWHDGVTSLVSPAPQTCGGAATAVNERGQIVGTCTSGDTHGFVWEDGATEDLVFLEGGSFPEDINETGEIVGLARRVGDETGVFRAVYWDGVNLTEILPQAEASWAVAINDQGLVAGFDRSTWPWQGFLWDGTTFADLEGEFRGGWASVMPSALNDSAQVVGSVPGEESGWSHAVLWEAGVITDLGSFAGTTSYALDVNTFGDIVGRSRFDPDVWGDHGFLWRDGVLYDLNDLVEDFAQWTIHEAKAINDVGQVLVFALGETSGRLPFLLTPVTPARRVERLIEWIEELDLGGGLENSYLVKLQHALDALDAGDTAAACSHLQSFLNHVAAQAGQKIPQEDADGLIGATLDVRDELGCS